MDSLKPKQQPIYKWLAISWMMIPNLYMKKWLFHQTSIKHVFFEFQAVDGMFFFVFRDPVVVLLFWLLLFFFFLWFLIHRFLKSLNQKSYTLWHLPGGLFTRKQSYSKHPFLGAKILVSGRVDELSLILTKVAEIARISCLQCQCLQDMLSRKVFFDAMSRFCFFSL